MEISAQAGCLIDTPLDVTKSAWAIETLDVAWVFESTRATRAKKKKSSKG